MRDFAAWGSGFVKLGEYRRGRLASDLQRLDYTIDKKVPSAGALNITPELHIAKAAVKAVLLGLLAIPALYVFPLISPLVLALAAALYSKEAGRVQVKIRQKRDAINYELPRLVSTIDKTLEHNRDVLSMLEDYKRDAAPEPRSELAVTVADMRSGNYESALTRPRARVGSPRDAQYYARADWCFARG